MINYSIVMRSVNANLFEINQAKSRIKAAEKAGQAPSSEDVALVATEKQNAFAIRANVLPCGGAKNVYHFLS